MGSFLVSEAAAGEEAELTGNGTMTGQFVIVAKEREEKRGGGVESSRGDGW